MTQDAQYRDRRLVALYERLNKADHDHGFYERRLGSAPQHVLDLGCGTGPLARRLVRLGHTVVAADPAWGMIEWGRQQAGTAGIVWHYGVAQDLPSGDVFNAAIMTGHAFQCLTTDAAVAETLAAVRARLRLGGRFMFESRNPQAREWESWIPEDADVVLDDSGAPVRCFTSVVAVEDGPRVTFRNHFVFAEGEAISQSTLLFLSADAIRAHLLAAGFTDIAMFGHWDGRPLTDASPEIIVIAA